MKQSVNQQSNTTKVEPSHVQTVIVKQPDSQHSNTTEFVPNHVQSVTALTYQSNTISKLENSENLKQARASHSQQELLKKAVKIEGVKVTYNNRGQKIKVEKLKIGSDKANTSNEVNVKPSESRHVSGLSEIDGDLNSVKGLKSDGDTAVTDDSFYFQGMLRT